jgi:para-nitrobenzyl esterase
LLILLVGCASTQTITLPSGPIVGIQHQKTREFLAIPYATAARWKPPAPVEWTKPRSATKSGPACAQSNSFGFVRVSDEDCLTLDVVAPAQGTKLPVFVWIHGGAFIEGSGSDPFYDAVRLVERTQTVVVKIKYRLGPLGFMSHPELAREMGREVSPSFGLLDQRAALEWVQRNIAAFGGDPANVTIFGDSAGAWSVCSQLASPKSKGLFARAIMHSGACSNALYFTAREAEAQSHQLAAKVGCAGDGEISCMRKKSAKELANALPFRRGLLLLPGVWWGPVIDGVELPRLPLESMKRGESAEVPLVIGTARDEGFLHTYRYDHVEPSELTWFARGVFGDEKKILEHYAGRNPKDALNDIVSNGIFSCNSRRVARTLTARGVPVYLYEWAHTMDDKKAHKFGATHGIDLFFLWGGSGGIGLSEREQPLSRTMIEAWSRFAHAGDPWPRYTLEGDQNFTFELPPKMSAHLKSDECDFWDRLEIL